MARVTAVLLLLLHPASNRPMTSVAQIDANRTFILLSPMPVAFLARLKAWSSPIQNVRLTVKRKVETGSKKLIRCVFT